MSAYLRYCDDFILLSNDSSQLEVWREQIVEHLRDRLKLELNTRQQLSPVSNGVNFLGYIVRSDYLLVRRRVVNNLKQKLSHFKRLLVREDNGIRCYRFDERILNELATVVSSYLGHFKLANSYRLWQALWKRFCFLAQYFEFDVNKWKLLRKYQTPVLKRVRQQYRYFRWRFPQDVVFLRVGKFIEFYDIIEPPWLKLLGLQPMAWNRRCVLWLSGESALVENGSLTIERL